MIHNKSISLLNMRQQTKQVRKNTMFRICVLIYFCSLLILVGCKKFVTVNDPKMQLDNAAVFSSDATAKAAILGIYSRMMVDGGFAGGGSTSVTFLSGLSADEFRNFQVGDALQFYTNSLSPNNNTLTANLWSEPYQYIYSANAIIEGLEKSLEVSPIVKTQLTAEAKFVRAFCYFYLVNLFGDVPLITKTDFAINASAPKTSKLKVYQQIIEDLLDAKNNLPEDFSTFNSERTRPCKWAASALLARAYLFQGDWQNAESEATTIINEESLFHLYSDIDSVFLANSEEAIWQLRPVRPGFNTWEGFVFIINYAPNFVSLSNNLLSAFETGDARREKWVGQFSEGADTWFYPYKYKIGLGSPTVNEYSTVFRLSEQFLIRAESRAHLNNISDAQADINKLRTRAMLPDVTGGTESTMVNAILHERQVELFAEWGHRWQDLQRTGAIDSVMGSVISQKGGSWRSDFQLYPIPLQEILNNPFVNQNKGY
jgi:starch-binding outer membrane protein, SusD/RagB family